MPLDPGSLRGAFTPLVTPFDDGAIDWPSFDSSLGRQADAGARGVVVAGTTGEPTSLTVAERERLYRRAVEVAGGELGVVAATGSANHAETLALTAAAEAAGADAVLVVVPAFVKPSQEGLVQHFGAVADSTALPVLIYNIPGRAGTAVTAETVEHIVDRHKNVVGLKHASPDLDLVTDVLLRLGDDFRLFCGLESLSYPFLAVGGAGLMSAVGNLLATKVVALCDAAEAGDHAAALALHRELFALNQAVFFDTNPVPLKYMMSRHGLGSAEVRPPLAPLSDATAARVRAVADRYVEQPAHVGEEVEL